MLFQNFFKANIPMSDGENREIDAIQLLHQILRFRNAHPHDNDDDDDELLDPYDEYHCSSDEIIKIKSSFDENREKKTSKRIEKPKQRELTDLEITRLSEEEDRLTNNIRKYISNKKLLFEVLSELNGVNPKDPIFEEFY